MNSAPDSTAPAPDEATDSCAAEASAASGGRTLFARPVKERQTMPDAKTRLRRERLQAHAQRAGERREALLALLRSSALAELVLVDPQLKRDVSRLLAFVLDDVTPQ